jgi:hypothetical protein
MNVCDLMKRVVSSAIVVAASALPLGAASPDCAALAAWALENQTELPRDYRRISAFPFQERQAIYGILTPEEKVAYWQDRIKHFLSTRPELTSDQVAAIEIAATYFQPEIYRLERMSPKERAAIEERLDVAAAELYAAVGETIVTALTFRLGSADDRFATGPASFGEESNLACFCDSHIQCIVWSEGPAVCSNPASYPCTNFQNTCGAWGNKRCTGYCNAPGVP